MYLFLSPSGLNSHKLEDDAPKVGMGFLKVWPVFSKGTSSVRKFCKNEHKPNKNPPNLLLVIPVNIISVLISFCKLNLPPACHSVNENFFWLWVST